MILHACIILVLKQDLLIEEWACLYSSYVCVAECQNDAYLCIRILIIYVVDVQGFYDDSRLCCLNFMWAWDQSIK